VLVDGNNIDIFSPHILEHVWRLGLAITEPSSPSCQMRRCRRPVIGNNSRTCASFSTCPSKSSPSGLPQDSKSGTAVVSRILTPRLAP
jgi:hypothetical protein